jgi:hypothetical protein
LNPKQAIQSLSEYAEASKSFEFGNFAPGDKTPGRHAIHPERHRAHKRMGRYRSHISASDCIAPLAPTQNSGAKDAAAQQRKMRPETK